tara:strand:+ start:42 stop:233 length:192 start_codon:yes stop_codon:yes gene_type:complete
VLGLLVDVMEQKQTPLDVDGATHLSLPGTTYRHDPFHEDGQISQQYEHLLLEYRQDFLADHTA